VRTPVDAFATALHNLVAQKAAAEAPKKTPRQAAVGYPGEVVRYMPPTNMHPDMVRDRGALGVVAMVGGDADMVEVTFLDGTNTGVVTRRVWCDQVAPIPELNDIANIDAWLAS